MLTVDRATTPRRSVDRLAARGLVDLDIQRRDTKPKPGSQHRLTLGLRWIIEETNRGGRATGSSAATPTGDTATAAPRSASPPPSQSSDDSSATATDGALHRAYPLGS